MKVRTIDLDDEGLPETVVVEMALDEAALYLRLVGGLPPRTITEALGNPKWAEVLSSVYNGLTGDLFNRFWDDGVDGVIARWPGYGERLKNPLQVREPGSGAAE